MSDRATQAEPHRVAYCRALGLDPATTLFAPVARELAEAEQIDEPLRVSLSVSEQGTVDVVLTRL